MTSKPTKPFILVLTGPSGVGKSTVSRELLKKNDDIVYSVSVTTRQKREGEIDGKDYYFVGRDGFEDLIEKGELVEWAEVYGEYYGTPLNFINSTLESGKHVLLDTDTQGGARLRSRFEDGVFIFLLAPSFETLQKRLYGRGTESKEVRKERIESAGREMDEISGYSYLVVNDHLEETVRSIQAIICAEEHRVGRISDLSTWLDRLKGTAVP